MRLLNRNMERVGHPLHIDEDELGNDMALVMNANSEVGFVSPGKREAYLGNRSTGSVARSAQEYIENHYDSKIRMEDLCHCTGVSMRTLQRSFSVSFHASPFEYIKARRLNAARQALVAGDPSRDRVTRIAVDNGFTHLGRFSVDYREHFDESPKETLVGEARSLRRAGQWAA